MRRFVALLIAAAPFSPQLVQAREVVPFRDYPASTTVVATGARQLYYVIGNGQAIRYPVGVGRAGMAWRAAWRDAKHPRR
jgi:lipoprotein-anchoring transpeptidase ErfK/SrfK